MSAVPLTLGGRFAVRLTSVNDAPQPLGRALQEQLTPGSSLRLLIYGPPDLQKASPTAATLLGVTGSHWIVVSYRRDRGVTVARCAFNETMLIELTAILLYGLLRFGYAANGRAQFAEIEFNTVMEDLYEEAVQLVLDGVDPIAVPLPVDRRAMRDRLQSLPLPFLSAALRYLRGGQRLLRFAYWPSGLGDRRHMFRTERLPATLLLLTERELVIISKTRIKRQSLFESADKYGNVVTYCPLRRLAEFRTQDGVRISTLELELSSPGGTGTLSIDLPINRGQEVLALIAAAIEQRSASSEPHPVRTCLSDGCQE